MNSFLIKLPVLKAWLPTVHVRPRWLDIVDATSSICIAFHTLQFPSHMYRSQLRFIKCTVYSLRYFSLSFKIFFHQHTLCWFVAINVINVACGSCKVHLAHVAQNGWPVAFSHSWQNCLFKRFYLSLVVLQFLKFIDFTFSLICTFWRCMITSIGGHCFLCCSGHSFSLVNVESCLRWCLHILQFREYKSTADAAVINSAGSTILWPFLCSTRKCDKNSAFFCYFY